jgi:hypothetical protein
MHLVQLLLPLFTSAGMRVGDAPFAAVRRELTERFGGVTAYMRAPALGLWTDDNGQVARDEVVMVEVVVDELDPAWWISYREILAARFGQEVVHARALKIEPL